MADQWLQESAQWVQIVSQWTQLTDVAPEPEPDVVSDPNERQFIRPRAVRTRLAPRIKVRIFQ